MRHYRTFFAIAALALLISRPALSADYAIDPAHTQVTFAVGHLGYSTTIGWFRKLSGRLTLDEARPENSRVEVLINTSSLDTGLEARDAHLKNPDFFNVATHPTIAFRSTKVERTGERTADVFGDLDLLGVTKPAVLKVTFNRKAPDRLRGNAEIIGFTGTTSVRRSEFGMTAYVPYISDDVSVTINVEAIAAPGDADTVQ